MKVTEAEFVISAVGPDQYPVDGLPEIALAGRSNVGKSSLLNRMMQRKNLARTSAKPGKTQALNYYRVDGKFYFVDVPGYGYAQVSKSLRERWGRIMEAYLLNRKALKMVLLVIDIRHEPSREDRQMFEWLRYYGVRTRVIATKADKIPRSRHTRHLKEAAEKLGMDKGELPLLFSSLDGTGVDTLWSWIAETATLEMDQTMHKDQHS